MQNLHPFLLDHATKRRRSAARSRRDQRLEAAASLAGGLAHDLSKVVTPMLLAAELAQRAQGSRPPAPLLDILYNGTSRAAAMARRMHALTGGEGGKFSTVNVRNLLADIAATMRTLHHDRITVRTRVSKALPEVIGNFTRLRQALLNVCENACEAMPGGGTLSLLACPSTKGEAGLPACSCAEAGALVRISVLDTGRGMTPELADRAFDPFFTTKSTGKATGLGLPTAYSIVKAHGGLIDFDSTPGKGTCVHIHLPARSKTDSVRRPAK